jgi:hypothetical protein
MNGFYADHLGGNHRSAGVRADPSRSYMEAVGRRRWDRVPLSDDFEVIAPVALDHVDRRGSGL